MTTLFIHEVGYLEKPLFEMHEFPEYLVSKGEEVLFLDYPENGKRRYRDFLSLRPRTVQGRTRDVKLTLLSGGRGTNSVLSRIAYSLIFPVHLLLIFARYKPNRIYLYAVPTSGWQTVLLAKIFSVPVTFRALDVSHSIRGDKLRAIVKIAEFIVYQFAERVSANNPEMRDYIARYLREGYRGKLDVCLAPVNRELFTRAKPLNEVARRFGGRVIIMYVGTFFSFSGLESVLGQFAADVNLQKKYALVLVGDGEMRTKLEHMIRQHSLEEDCLLTGMVGFGELASYMNSADIFINSLQPLSTTHIAIPHKVLQYLTLDKPIVSTRLRGLSRALVESRVSISWVDDPTQIWEGIRSLGLPLKKPSNGFPKDSYEEQLSKLADSLYRSSQT